MTAEEIIGAIHGSYARGSKHGLRNMQALREQLFPVSRVPMIHVAGTNGKGSTCAMLESILRHAGLRTGLYTSPFLQNYRERIRLEGLPIDDERMVKYGVPLLEAAARLREQGTEPTPFELGTVLALSAFEGESSEAAVIEVGMGGRLDPTNVILPRVCAVTAIGLDHMEYLGDTLEKIAGEKAGIFKPGVPAVCQQAEDGVAAVFREAAERVGAPLVQLRPEQLLKAECDRHGSTADFELENTWKHVRVGLPGRHQQANAMTALSVVEQLRHTGMDIPDEAVYAGMERVVWPARLEWCGNVLIDGAHNAQGIGTLLEFTLEHLAGIPKVLLSGVLADKLTPAMTGELAQLADIALTVTPDNPRALPAEEYALALSRAGMNARAVPDVASGLEEARNLTGENGVVIASGSLYFSGMVRNALHLGWR